MTRLQSVPYKWLVAAVFVTGLFMDLLDTTIVNVALPTLARDFDAGTTTIEWVVTGYLLSLAVWIPASGWLGDRFGTKRVFMFALAMFTLGSALCGTANSIETLIFFRVLQGIGGGMLTPVGTAMLFRAFPPQERAAASAVLVIPVAVAPTIGPIIGGLLVDNLSWRWIFYVNVPIGVLAFIFAALVLREHREPNPGRFDILGFLLSGTGLPLVLYALAEAPGSGWTSTKVLVTGLGGIALLALLVVVELREREPLLDLRLFNDRMFRSANLVNFAASAGLLGVLFLLPLFLQNPALHNLSATESGLTTFPQAIGLVIASRFTSKLYPRVGPRRLMAFGSLLTAVATSLFLGVDASTDLWWIRAIMFVRGISFAFAIIPLQAATFANISQADTGRASSIFNANRQVAASFGVAILATVLADRTPANPDTAELVSAFHDAFFAAVILALVALAASFLIHDEDAAASMAPPKREGAGQAEAQPVVTH
jgi:EmrB/QacA subfamily drug resistance transporter